MNRKSCLWKDRRKKTWRRLAAGGHHLIRLTCISILLFEVVWLIPVPFPSSIALTCKSRMQPYEILSMEKQQEKKQREKLSICFLGISIEWKQGQLVVYRQEEYDRWVEEHGNLSHFRKD